MRRVFGFLVLAILATVVASCYGIVHDQLTYSISPEYYTKFKFFQFGFEQTSLGNVVETNLGKEYSMSEPRFGALLVGVMATWWFGALLGSILALVSIVLLKTKVISWGLKAILIAVLVASLTGLAGYLFGSWMEPHIPAGWYLPENVSDKHAFVLVGHMHNFSYAGGALGLLVGIAYLVLKSKTKKAIG